MPLVRITRYAILICLLQVACSTALFMMFGYLDDGDTYSDYLFFTIRFDSVMAFVAFACFILYGKKSNEYLHAFIILGLVILVFELISLVLPNPPKPLILIALQYVLLVLGALLGMKIGQGYVEVQK